MIFALRPAWISRARLFSRDVEFLIAKRIADQSEPARRRGKAGGCGLKA